MTKRINVVLTEKHSYHNYTGLYRAEIGKHKLEINQASAEKLHDMVHGKWDAEFDDGAIRLEGFFEWPYQPNRCEHCGAKIPHYRTWCDNCLREMMTP